MIFNKSFATFITLASVACTIQADMLRISNPTAGTTWKTGETVFLQWMGNCASMEGQAAKDVDVNLMTGDAQALRFVAKLASIDCSGSETRKEFTIPADLVKESGNYSLSVQTVPALSYSNIFKIESTTSAPPAGTGAGTGTAGGAAPGAGGHSQGGASAPANSGSITTAGSFAGVALAAVIFASQLL